MKRGGATIFKLVSSDCGLKPASFLTRHVKVLLRSFNETEEIFHVDRELLCTLFLLRNQRNVKFLGKPGSSTEHSNVALDFLSTCEGKCLILAGDGGPKIIFHVPVYKLSSTNSEETLHRVFPLL